MTPREHQIQEAFVELLSLCADHERMMWLSIPNERAMRDARDESMLRRLVRMGLKPGAADLLVMWDQPMTCFIEFKAPSGKQTTLQRRFADEVRRVGASYLVHTDAHEALTNLEQLGAPLKRRLVAGAGRAVLAEERGQ